MDFSEKMTKKASVFTDKLGGNIRWTPAGGIAKSIRGIFSKKNELGFAGSMSVQTTKPIVYICTKLIPGIAREDTIIIQDITYSVMRFENDVNTGTTKVFLKVT